MTLTVNLERIEERWVAFVNGLPGCYSSHSDREQAALGVAPAVEAYLDWTRWNGVLMAGVEPTGPVLVEEIFTSWVDPQNGTAVQAFFAADVQALTAAETSLAAALLDWTRAELLQVTTGLEAPDLAHAVPGLGSIQNILARAVQADWQYLNALGLAPNLEGTPDSRTAAINLEWTQSLYLDAFTKLSGQTRLVFAGHELWSPRKLLRRVLWRRRSLAAQAEQVREQLKG